MIMRLMKKLRKCRNHRSKKANGGSRKIAESRNDFGVRQSGPFDSSRNVVAGSMLEVRSAGRMVASQGNQD
jgi:hypothetical protein